MVDLRISDLLYENSLAGPADVEAGQRP